MNRFRQIAIAALAALTLGMVACTKPVTTGDDSLYNRLGALAGGDGKAAITVAVDKFLEKVVADDRINFFFANANVPRLRAMLIDQVCEVSGGPCKYTGGDMVTVHKGMNITESQFIALVEDLRQALVEIGVPIHEMNELVGLLAPLKRQITYNGVEAG
ncbi:MAG: group 1 truncated hemoglobin [Chromatiales bacterium]|nr:group 1 truncated hemoglobin [Chromatiales bacterium]